MMAPDSGNVWWNRIGRSLRLLQEIGQKLSNRESFVLQAPGGIPWRDHFYGDALLGTLSGISSEYMLRVVSAAGRAPGDLCLQELCSQEFRGKYWPTRTQEAYLCTNPGIPFHSYYIWVRDIENDDALVKWERFARGYRKEAEAAGLPRRALFILEYPGAVPEKDALPVLSYSYTPEDCRVYCMEVISDAGMQPEDYLTELAVQTGGGNPEVCQALLGEPTRFCYNPMETAEEVLSRFEMVETAKESNCRFGMGETAKESSGSGGLGEKEGGDSGSAKNASWEESIRSAVWKAQVILLFPQLEQYRMNFIQEHAGELQYHLPLRGSNGENITDIMDLEFGNLYFVLHRDNSRFTRQEENAIEVCRDARNILAHNRLLDYHDILQLRKIL